MRLTEAEHRERGCESKKRYASRGTAEMSIRTMKRRLKCGGKRCHNRKVKTSALRRLQVYKCQFCPAWHVGKAR